MERGFFITLEGIEGSGKSTQLTKLSEALTKKGYEIVSTREPGGTPFGQKLRDLLVHSKDEIIDPELEVFLFLADRAFHVKNVIQPALWQKKIVLSDRFIDSTMAYQSFGRKLPFLLLDGMNKFATGGLQPDLTLFLDLPVEDALARIEGRENNRMDKESPAFYQTVRKGYYALARKNRRIAVIDAGQPTETVFEKSLAKIEEMLKANA